MRQTQGKTGGVTDGKADIWKTGGRTYGLRQMS